MLFLISIVDFKYHVWGSCTQLINLVISKLVLRMKSFYLHMMLVFVYTLIMILLFLTYFLQRSYLYYELFRILALPISILSKDNSLRSAHCFRKFYLIF